MMVVMLMRLQDCLGLLGATILQSRIVLLVRRRATSLPQQSDDVKR